MSHWFCLWFYYSNLFLSCFSFPLSFPLSSPLWNTSVLYLVFSFSLFSFMISAFSILFPCSPSSPLSSPFHSKIMIMIVVTIISSCLLIVLQEHAVLSVSDHRWLPKSHQPGGWIVGSQWGRWESVGGTQQAVQNHSTANTSDNEMSNIGN